MRSIEQPTYIQRPVEWRNPSSYEQAIRGAVQSVSGAEKVYIEGSPIYCIPDPERPPQKWDNPAFVNGWRFLQAVTRYLPEDKVQHFSLIDDYNVPDENFHEEGGVLIDNRLHNESDIITSIASATTSLQKNKLFTGIPHDFTQGTGFFETTFVTKNGIDRCSNLDAAFQKTKLLHRIDTDEAGDMQSALAGLRMLIVHPVKFQDQQSMMLSRLLGEMKQPPFDRIPKKQRQQALSDIYRHVWFNNDGSVESITNPKWDGNKFIHERITNT